MFAFHRWSLRVLAAAVASVVCVAAASAQPPKSRPNFPPAQRGGVMPQINTSPYANGSIERALLQQQLSIARRDNPYAFYPNPWLYNPVYPPVVVNPWVGPPVVNPFVNPWAVNPWAVNPVFPITPVPPVNPVVPVNPVLPIVGPPVVNPWVVNPWPVAPWQAVNPWAVNPVVTAVVTPPVAIQQPGAFIPRNVDTAVNPWSGAVLKPISGVAIQPDGSVFYRAPETNTYINPESGAQFNPTTNVISRPATTVFLPWMPY